MSLKHLPLTGALLLASWGAAAEPALEGRYAIEGKSPGEGAPYEGEVEVRRTGATYAVAWRTTGGNYVGTGIVTGGVFSIIYTSVQGRGVPGLANYEIVDDKVTKGTWTSLGARAIGTETWTALPPRKPD